MTTDGWTAPGFEGVRAAFEHNLASGRDVGAAFSAYHRGEKVVDLWGGVADTQTGRLWEEDTLALVFSTTTGVTAVCANRLIDEGRLDPDAPVVEYWPEFGRHGKETVPVRHVLSHRVGLAWIDGDMTLEEALSWEPVIEALENQRPHWEPGSTHGYHATTFGWLVGELVRRVAGRSVGTYLRDEIADPLDLDLWIGLPAEHEPRVAPLISMLPPGVTAEALTEPGDNPILKMIADFLGPQTELGKSLYAPGNAFIGTDIWNDPRVHGAEIPAANGIADARSLAKLYAACLGEVDGVRLLSPEQLDRAITQQTEGPNRVLLGLDVQFGLGFMLHTSLLPIGGPRAFGHFGMGGSVAWADPDAELAYAYVMNKMELGVTGDPRSSALIDACYASL